MSCLSAFQNIHQNETIIVCGCGESLNRLDHPEQFITIGVNDVGRRFQPTYLVVVNPRNQFSGDRFRYVEASTARAIFTQLDLGLSHRSVVKFRLGKYGGADFSDSNVLHYAQNSPYVALCLASHMGAKRIGLIGVDFTDHHFFARTGTHALAAQLRTIDEQYRRLAEALRARGVEVFNLSPDSRITAFPKMAVDDFRALAETESVQPATAEAGTEQRRITKTRIFFVNYKFLSCGEVFTDGLRNAARSLEIPFEDAYWDDSRLPAKIASFKPDWLFVVHGRRFVERWRNSFTSIKKAVWLLDEPYEVDDTEKTSRLFDAVFVNDPSTLERHRNAHYLPVAFDPNLHRPGAARRDYVVGFIGGGNPSRERFLNTFADAGRLSYVVGGPWTSQALQRLSLAANVSPSRTAELYQRTRIVLNVFRDKHHFNRRAVPAWSLNPRVYEAFACGAMVISENRPEAAEVFPDMPVFRSPAEALDIAQALMSAPQRAEALVESCRSKLGQHTYAARLHTVLEAALGTKTQETIAMPEIIKANSIPTVAPPLPGTHPRYAILMVVCGGLDMVRVSTLKTLRHSHGKGARLVVVDNGSHDGTECWLRMLAARGDIELIRLEENIGHGPALEKARAASDSKYIVTLDSDAFPLADDWLEKLEARIDDQTLAAGIGHHRGYVHPSCLMIDRRTLDRLGSTFLNEKRKASRFDVAERLSHDILASGGKLSFLERTASQCRASDSEPVYLGSEYESIVYHQWYTTRHLNAKNAQVDDVPRDAFVRTFQETIRRFDSEPRELTVVVGLRVTSGQPERERNAAFTLESLNHQDLERWRYRIVVVEQDEQPRLEHKLGPLTDRWIFAPNPGSYNRGWGFNVGASQPLKASGALCLSDADLLHTADSLRIGLAKLGEGARAVLPYSECRFLTSSATGQILAEHSRNAPAAAGVRRYEGQRFLNSSGGVMFVDATTFFAIGGFDERFEGWGAEDREMWLRLTRHYRVEKLDRVLVHLHHARPDESGPDAKRNRALFERLRRLRPAAPAGPIGCLDKYQVLTSSRASRRDWLCWDTWAEAKIERVVQQELETAGGTRPLDAKLLERFGPNVLDVGCGPAAVYARLHAQGTSVSWMGADITGKMLMVARKLFPALPLVHADASLLPFGDRSFDAVLLRHVLEHLPEELMRKTLSEVLRVASRIAIVDFYVKPGEGVTRDTRRVGNNVFETRWSVSDVQVPVEQSGGHVMRRHAWAGDSELWILAPRGSDLDAADIDGVLRQEPKVSIIMPTYRRSHVLRRTLQSVRKQSYPNWELILVDNAGDVTLAIDDPRIRLFRHAEKASASYARNRGVQHATGELVCFFDDDDIMFPSYLESFVAAFRTNPNASMVRCGMLVAGHKVNYSHATPECCVRREFATPSWDNRGPCQDQRYFKRIVARHRWSEQQGDIVVIRQPLCQACQEPKGGLRSGKY